MNGLIASLLKDRISAFTFLGKLGGLVRAVEYERAGDKITIPVAGDVDDPIACDDSEIRHMIPDERYTTIAYFEDRGCTSTKSRTRGISWESRLRLVVWVNTKMLNGDPVAADKIAQQLQTAIESGFYNSGPFIGLKHDIEGMPQRGLGLFQGYTYASSSRQFLLQPFDAIALDIVTSFRIKAGCEDQVTVSDVACWTPPTTRRRRNPNEFTCAELTDPVTGLTPEQLADCLNCSGSFVMALIHYSNHAAAAADNTTVPTTQQMVVIDDTKNAYFGDGTSTVQALLAGNRYALGVRSISDKGLNIGFEGTPDSNSIQLNDPLAP